MSEPIGFAPDAAVALGIASTAMPFTGTRRERAEQWLRVLRLHGEAGAVLQALGVGERGLARPLRPVRPAERDAAAETEAGMPVVDRAGAGADAGEREGAAEVAEVAAYARGLACARGAAAVATTDLLLAVMRLYGCDLRVLLETHGTDREEVRTRLAVDASGQARASAFLPRHLRSSR